MKSHVIIPIQGIVEWATFRDRKSNEWVGVCEALNITVSGKDQNHLVEIMNDAIDGLLNDLVEDQEFEAFLKDKGWALMVAMPIQPVKRMSFDVPLSIQPMQGSKIGQQKYAYQQA